MSGDNLDSHKLKEVGEFLRRRRTPYITELRVRPSDGSIIASVPRTAIGKRVEKGKTSQRQLKYVSKAVHKELGVNIEFIVYRGEGQEQLEAGLCELLKRRFPQTVGDCFISFPVHSSAELWIDFIRPVSSVQSKLLENLRKTSTKYLNLFNVQISQIHWTGVEKEWPSLVAVLRIVKKSAPVPVSEIEKLLKDEGFALPSSGWLKTKLDSLRKKGMVQRQEDGSFIVTEMGLRFVPHGAFRSSSDIDRALVLGKRKWY